MRDAACGVYQDAQTESANCVSHAPTRHTHARAYTRLRVQAHGGWGVRVECGSAHGALRCASTHSECAIDALIPDGQESFPLPQRHPTSAASAGERTLLRHCLILLRLLLQVHLALCHLARVFGLLFEILETLHLEPLR